MPLMEWKAENALCPPHLKDTVLFDQGGSGLGVRITAGGNRDYIYQCKSRDGGTQPPRRIHLGLCSRMSLAEAREAAENLWRSLDD